MSCASASISALVTVASAPSAELAQMLIIRTVSRCRFSTTAVSLLFSSASISGAAAGTIGADILLELTRVSAASGADAETIGTAAWLPGAISETTGAETLVEMTLPEAATSEIAASTKFTTSLCCSASAAVSPPSFAIPEKTAFESCVRLAQAASVKDLLELRRLPDAELDLHQDGWCQMRASQ